MERLNDIINRTSQRRQQNDPHDAPEQHSQPERRAMQGQRPERADSRPGSQGSPLTRRPLPEQTARLGQQGMPAPRSQAQSPSVPPRKYYQHTSRFSQAPSAAQTPQAPRNRIQSEQDYTPRPRYAQQPPQSQTAREAYPSLSDDQAHVTRPLYNYDQQPRRNDANATSRSSYYRNTSRFAQEPPQSPSLPQEGDYYDAYPAYPQHPSLPQADVQEEWEDDIAAMRNGDWEDDGSELPPYTSSASPSPTAARSPMGNMGRVPNTGYAHTSHTPRDLPDPYSRESEMEPRGSGAPYSPPTRNLRELREMQGIQEMPSQTQMPASRLSVPSALPAPQALPQETRHHRHTQPLDPQTIVNMTRDGQPEQARSAQSARLQDARMPSSQSSSPARGLCPICRGAGFLRADVPYGHPNFGKPIACECKEAERREKRRQQLMELSDLSAFQQSSFKNFNTRFPGVHSTVKEAFEEAFRFAQNPSGWLVLIGPNGCGKTHLAAAIANQHLRGGAVVLFTVVPDLLAHLRSTFSANATEAYDQRFAKMREAELLVLDDLGAHQSSAWASEKLFQLLNYRYNSGFPTVITANRQGLAGLDERILSRMSDTALVTTVVMNGAVDYRRQNPRREPAR